MTIYKSALCLNISWQYTQHYSRIRNSTSRKSHWDQDVNTMLINYNEHTYTNKIWTHHLTCLCIPMDTNIWIRSDMHKHHVVSQQPFMCNYITSFQTTVPNSKARSGESHKNHDNNNKWLEKNNKRLITVRIGSHWFKHEYIVDGPQAPHEPSHTQWIISYMHHIIFVY